MGIALLTRKEDGPWGLSRPASPAPCRYTTVVHPLIRYRRSEELLMRWMELNAFTTIFRTHEVSNPPAPLSWQAHAQPPPGLSGLASQPRGKFHGYTWCRLCPGLRCQAESSFTFESPFVPAILWHAGLEGRPLFTCSDDERSVGRRAWYHEAAVLTSA
jgi:hypothetical protein